MLRKMISLLFTLMFISFSAIPVNALEQSDLTIDMGILKIPTEYSLEDTRVDYRIDGNRTIANIIDISTGEIIDSYEQVIVEERSNDLAYDNFSLNSSRSYITVHLTRTYNKTSDSRTQITVFVRARLYKEVIAGQTVYTLISVEDYDHYLSGSGPFNLESKYTSIRTQSSSYCDINITGVMKTTNLTAMQFGLNVELLESLGFDVTFTGQNTWYARLSYNASVRFYV